MLWYFKIPKFSYINMSSLQQSERYPDNGLPTESSHILPRMDGTRQIPPGLQIYEKSKSLSRQTLKSALAHLHCRALKIQLPTKAGILFTSDGTLFFLKL